MTAGSPFKTELVRIANEEHARLGPLRRGNLELRRSIETYCRDVGIVVPHEIDDYHYSAVFISWCMRKAGASETEFPATERSRVHFCDGYSTVRLKRSLSRPVRGCRAIAGMLS
jgi:hypothetical protein